MTKWLALALALASGCGEEPAPAPSPDTADLPAPVRQRVEEATDQLAPPPSAAWPSEVRSLREAVDDFESVDACLAELRARTPTAVAEGVSDLSYDGFFDDVCRGLAAVHDGSVEGCDALDVSTARRGCRRRLALVQGEPTACPEDAVTPGLDPVCVAWAARSPDLCRAAPDAERARCRAVLADDVSGCRRLRPGDRDRCEAEIRRYASALGEERHAHPAAVRDATFRLEVTEEGGDAPTVIERDVLDRGVRLVARGCRHLVALARPVGELPMPVSPGRFEPTFQLELSIAAPARTPLEIALGATDAVLSLALPEHGGLTSIAGAEGAVTVTALEPRIGGAVDGTFEGQLRRADVVLVVEGRFSTFVRDVEALPDHCGGPEGEGERE